MQLTEVQANQIASSLNQTGVTLRKQAKSRANAGPNLSPYRQNLRDAAKDADDLANYVLKNWSNP